MSVPFSMCGQSGPKIQFGEQAHTMLQRVDPWPHLSLLLGVNHKRDGSDSPYSFARGRTPH